MSSDAPPLPKRSLKFRFEALLFAFQPRARLYHPRRFTKPQIHPSPY